MNEDVKHSHIPERIETLFMKPKAIFLDMDETLCDTKSADEKAFKELLIFLEQTFPNDLCEKIAETYLKNLYQASPRPEGFVDEAVERNFRVKLFHDALGEISPEHQQIEAYFEELEDYFHARRLKVFGFFTGVKEMLSRLREKYVLGVISNGPRYSQRPKVEKVDMQDHVDFILIGGEQKKQKPHPDIFSTALGLASCQANEAIHVGDSQHADMGGAKSSGILSVWISGGRKPREDKPMGDHTIENIIELEGLLESLV